MTRTNYNHLHIAGDFTVSIGETSQMTLKELRDSISGFPDDTVIHVSPCDCGCLLRLVGFDRKGPKDILFEVSCRELRD